MRMFATSPRIEVVGICVVGSGREEKGPVKSFAFIVSVSLYILSIRIA